MTLNETINEYYLMVKYDLEDGADLEDIQLGLKDLEEREEWLACAGVQMAIQEHLSKGKETRDSAFDTFINGLING